MAKAPLFQASPQSYFEISLWWQTTGILLDPFILDLSNAFSHEELWSIIVEQQRGSLPGCNNTTSSGNIVQSHMITTIPSPPSEVAWAHRKWNRVIQLCYLDGKTFTGNGILHSDIHTKPKLRMEVPARSLLHCPKDESKRTPSITAEHINNVGA